MTFEEAEKVFRSCFPRLPAEKFKRTGQIEISVPAFHIHNEYVFFRMWQVEEWHSKVYYVDFVIQKNADNRWQLIDQTTKWIDGNPELLREVTHWTYYADNHWQTRCPAWDEKTLKTDIELLKKAVAGLEGTTASNGTQLETKPPLPSVGIGRYGVLDLLKRELTIPDYQRAYCWTSKNIERLLGDLSDWHQKHSKDGKEYRLGSIILKRSRGGSCEVIDGQQRLITLALIAASQDSDFQVNIELGSNNQTRQALDAITSAKATIRGWHKELDLTQIVVSVVEIGEDESEDLAFNFFNHLNSSGVPLTDYELLKGHHLRYVQEDSVAKIMARRWHALDTGQIERLKEQLLHKCLFRIRKWLANEEFAWNADELESHDLFHEFTLDFEPQRLCTAYKEVAIDSMLSGGLEFFNYVNRYRMLFEQFIQQESVKAISPLKGHSHGTLHDAIFALAFLFFCRFGEIYLSDAIYAISWNISSLRAKGQVRRSYLGDKKEFHAAAMAIVRATHESEAIGKLLYKENLMFSGESSGAAGDYWHQLKACAEKLEGENTALLNAHYHQVFEPTSNRKEEGENA